MAAIPGDTEVAVPGRMSKRKAIRWALIALALLAACLFGYRYWRNAQLYATTDNAYVNANRVDISAQVSGPVSKLYVADNQTVKVGEPLFDIDPRTFQIALGKAEAQLQLASQSVSQQGAAVAAAQAQLTQRQAELNNAQENYARFGRLVAQGFYSEQGGAAARTQVATAQAAVKAAQANLEQARSALGQTGAENANIQAAAAAVEQARLDLQNAHVTAPADGLIANLALRPGSVVQAGAPLFILIGSQSFWIDANFKETELTRIHSGEQASIEVDMYPGHVFHGVVESLSGGSGSAFSLLPPQNATGNWVKVTQRVPVRVRVLDPDPRWPLRVGTTATVRIRVADAAGQASSRSG